MKRCGAVERALQLIEDGALNRDGIETLAGRLGVGTRHLSRLFQRHLGAPLLLVAKTRHLQRANRLLDESDLPMAEIAVRAGFPNTRRMSAAFAALYGEPPSVLRRRARPTRRHGADVRSPPTAPSSSSP